MDMLRSPKKLSNTLFASIFLYSLVAVLCFAAAFSAFFYISQEAKAEARLNAIAANGAAKLAGATTEADYQILSEQFSAGVRFSLISPDGAIIYDSEGKATSNHSDRPEVAQAHESGSGTVVRYSETLGQDSVYAAVLMDNGNVLRVSEQRASYLANLNSIALPLLGAIVLIAALSLALSRLLTARIIRPFDKVDIMQPLQHGTYKEMMPLLKRINEQQQQLREQNNELARAENLRREFSANVSHEMKTPLQVISGYAELMQTGTVSNDDIPKFAGIIHQESLQMSSLIDDVLTLSRLDDPLIENAGKEQLELFEFVKEVSNRLLSFAERRSVNLRTFGSTVHIVGNKQLLGQLVSNLISNAIRYSEEGAEVTVLVGKTLLGEHADELPEAFVRVKDQGAGIAPEELDKIFERFYRIDKSRSKENGGTGLGLAIAKHAATFHGANITVESKLGEGSIFTVHFPLA